jgi:hypothetical protein
MCCGFKLAKVCINLERTGYHAVDAGFWVVLELVIRWIRFQINLIALSRLVMFVPSSWTPNRLFSRIRLCSSRVKHVRNVCFK